jgi:hypothetical protein
MPITPTPTTPFTPIPIFPIPFFPSLDFGGVSRTFRGKQRKKYTPSFEALVFNIRGKQPKGLETGARIRPIPRGYSFAFKESPIKFGNFGSNFASGFAFQVG